MLCCNREHDKKRSFAAKIMSFSKFNVRSLLLDGSEALPGQQRVSVLLRSLCFMHTVGADAPLCRSSGTTTAI